MKSQSSCHPLWAPYTATTTVTSLLANHLTVFSAHANKWVQTEYLHFLKKTQMVRITHFGTLFYVIIYIGNISMLVHKDRSVSFFLIPLWDILQLYLFLFFCYSTYRHLGYFHSLCNKQSYNEYHLHTSLSIRVYICTMNS